MRHLWPCKTLLFDYVYWSNQVEFREDLKVLFEKAAVGGKPVTFLFNDNQVGLDSSLFLFSCLCRSNMLTVPCARYFQTCCLENFI